MAVKPRFVVADPEVCKRLGIPFIVMLSDIVFWVEHYDVLNEWCKQCNSKVMGMTVELPNAETLTAFALKWS